MSQKVFKLPAKQWHCERHGPGQQIYIACLCVLKSFGSVQYLQNPAPGKPGLLLCVKFFDGRSNDNQWKASVGHEEFELVPYCLKCAQEQKMNRIGAKLVEPPERGLVMM